MASDPIRVEEQLDEEGDIVFALTLRTYNRRHLDELSRVFETDLTFVRDGHGEWGEQFRTAEEVI